MLQQFDQKNNTIKIWVGNELLSREDAKISVFDSVVQGGDAVWEGLRVYEKGIFLLDRHLNRLMDSAKAMAFADIPSKGFILNALYETLETNDMLRSGVHIRMTLTRGEKITSGMDPRLNQSGPTLIILPEWKSPVYDNRNGIRVITSSIRRNSPAFVDSKIHHNNLINNILAKIQSNVAGVDAALMLDQNGFAAELNGTNIFAVKNGILLTPFADACLHGITREFIIQLARELSIPFSEKNLSLTEVYTSDELFATGTMGELTRIVEVDGRATSRKSLIIFNRLLTAFNQSKDKYCVSFESIKKGG